MASNKNPTQFYNVNVYNNIRKSLEINEPVDINRLEKIIYHLDDFIQVSNIKFEKETEDKEKKSILTMLKNILSNKVTIN